MKDLYVLVADQDMAETLKALLRRPESLGIRSTRHLVEKHIQHDPGCRTDASRRLRPHLRQYCRAIVVLDKKGCGRESASREDIQHEVERDLATDGWSDRAKAIVIDPELEAWVWSGSPHVAEVLGWSKGYEDLKAWLVDRDLWSASSAKPSEPKAAMRAALRETRRPPSAALFGQIAQRVTLRRCQCPAFAELKRTLQHWFGEEAV